MKNVRTIMLTFVTICILVISCIGEPKARIYQHDRDGRLLTKQLLDRVARNYGEYYDDDDVDIDEDRDRRDDFDIESDDYRHHPRSLQVRPYEDYSDYRRNHDDADNALYKQAIKEIYDDIRRRKRSKYNLHKDGNLNKENTEKRTLTNKKTVDKKSSTKETPKEVHKEEINVKVDKRDGLNLQLKSGKLEKSDNNQVAAVSVDDSVQRQEDFENKLDPAQVFLEPNSNGTSDNKTNPSTAHVKGNQPAGTTGEKKHDHHGLDDTSFIAIIAGCCVAGIAGMVLASFCWYKLRQESNPKDIAGSPVASKKTDSPTGMKPEDEKLVQSAEVFHYLHAKKQMQQMQEPPETAELAGSGDEDDDEDTVYECPGLAPPGDMKVMNPLFSDAESHHSDKQSDSPDGDSPLPPKEEVSKQPSLASDDGKPRQ